MLKTKASKMDTIKTITAKAPINIAVIKYWGKKDAKLNIPLNDSISATISMNELCTTTSITMSENYERNIFFLNNREMDWSGQTRLHMVIEKIRDVVEKRDTNFKWYNLHIYSKNNFPTAAGVASSASGFACMAFALCKMFSIDDPVLISRLARIGSGSACRSIFGGFVRWNAGHDDETSHAVQIMPENQWENLRVVILIAKESPKDIPSRDGMLLSKQTSELLQHRLAVLPKRIDKLYSAILRQDFQEFGEHTMKDSNQFHAICMDTYPPLRYLSDISFFVIRFVHYVNSVYGKIVAAYTFDAGPNATIFCESDYSDELLTLFEHLFPIKTEDNESNMEIPIYGIPFKKKTNIDSRIMDFVTTHAKPNALEYIFSTKLGTGPKVITDKFDDECLLSPDGIPVAE